MNFAFSLLYTEYVPYKNVMEDYTDEELKQIAEKELQKYLHELEKKGVQISENDVKIYRETNRYSAKGKLVLSGPFGIVQKGTVHELPKADAENIQQEGN